MRSPAQGQQFPLVRNGDLRRLACLDVGFERVRQVVDVHHRLRHARLGKPVERVVDQRFARDPNQRLGLAGGKRPHPLAEPGAEDHRGIGGQSGHRIIAPFVSSEVETVCWGLSTSLEANGSCVEFF